MWANLLISYIKIRKTIKGRKCYDVVNGGKENLLNFLEKVGFSDEERNKRIKEYSKHSPKPSLTNVIPIAPVVINLLKKLKLSQKEVVGFMISPYLKHNYNFTIQILRRVVKNLEKRIKSLERIREKIGDATSRKVLRMLREKARISTFDLAKKLRICHQMVSYLELHAKNFPLENYKKALVECIEEMLETKDEIENLKKLAFGETRWARDSSIEKIRNKDVKWVYDVTTDNENFTRVHVPWKHKHSEGFYSGNATSTNFYPSWWES